MSDSLLYTDIDDLVKEFDSADELWDALEAEIVDLPVNYQHLDPEEVKDLSPSQMNEDDAERISEWLVERRQAAGVYQKAKKRMGESDE